MHFPPVVNDDTLTFKFSLKEKFDIGHIKIPGDDIGYLLTRSMVVLLFLLVYIYIYM